VTDILSLFGTILVDVPLSDDGIDESLEVPGPDLGSKDTEFNAYGTDAENSSERRVDIEDELEAANTKELQDLAAANPENIQQQLKFDSKVLIKGALTNNARADEQQMDLGKENFDFRDSTPFWLNKIKSGWVRS
jgi:hypothetical protein